MFIQYSCCLERQKPSHVSATHSPPLRAARTGSQQSMVEPPETQSSHLPVCTGAMYCSADELSVLHCLRKESPGVLQLQSLAQVREAKDTAWNAPWIKQWRMGSQRVNITPTRRSGIHTAVPGTEFFLLPLKMFDGPTTGFIGHHYFCFSNFLWKNWCVNLGSIYFPEYEG